MTTALATGTMIVTKNTTATAAEFKLLKDKLISRIADKKDITEVRDLSPVVFEVDVTLTL